jgi:hypothetical protein
MELLVALGGSDCERIGTWVLRQPVNAGSAVAYVVAAVAVARRAVDRCGPHRRVLLGYAAALVGVGIGSVAYHGPQPGWAGPAHDLTIALAVGLAVAAVATAPPRPAEWRARHDAVVLAVVLAAAVAYAAGRTGSPACRPGSRLQPHAAWHVLSAASAVLLTSRPVRGSGRQAAAT